MFFLPGWFWCRFWDFMIYDKKFRKIGREVPENRFQPWHSEKCKNSKKLNLNILQYLLWFWGYEQSICDCMLPPVTTRKIHGSPAEIWLQVVSTGASAWWCAHTRKVVPWFFQENFPLETSSWKAKVGSTEAFSGSRRWFLGVYCWWFSPARQLRGQQICHIN